jgi:hypothetical protein
VSYERECKTHGCMRVEIHDGSQTGKPRTACLICEHEKAQAKRTPSGRKRRMPGPHQSAARPY